jgi:hypothetical protein
VKSGLVVLCLSAALLVSCDRKPAPAPQPVVAPVQTAERAGPVRWNAAAGVFEIGGAPLRTARLWTFDGSTDGFVGQGSEVIPADPQGLAVTMANSPLRSPRGLQAPGAQFPLVLVRLTRLAAGQGWNGALYYSTTLHGEGGDWLGLPLDNTPPKVGETVTLVYDMSRQARGAPDWTESVIEQIRLDLEGRGGGRFVIHQVALAAPSDGVALPAAGGSAAGVMEPVPAELRDRLAPAPVAKGCNVEEAALTRAGEGEILSLAGWISELGPANTSPEGLARLQGPGGDFVAALTVNGPRKDVARHFDLPSAHDSGFSATLRLPQLTPGSYSAWVYRRTPTGWVVCKAAQPLNLP